MVDKKVVETAEMMVVSMGAMMVASRVERMGKRKVVGMVELKAD